MAIMEYTHANKGYLVTVWANFDNYNYRKTMNWEVLNENKYIAHSIFTEIRKTWPQINDSQTKFVSVWRGFRSVQVGHKTIELKVFIYFTPFDDYYMYFGYDPEFDKVYYA